MTKTKSAIPDGFRADAQGRLVAEENIKPIDAARDALVAELVADARELHEHMKRFKLKAFGDIAAKELIDECLRDWTEGARAELRALIADAFRVDQAGKIRTGSVLALRRLDITDERWLRAMQAIGDAVQVVGSKSYVRAYERNDATGQYEAISLDIAGV